VPKKPLVEPHVSKELLEYMNQMFPDKCPDVTDTERKIWVNVGKREAFNHFQRLFKKQQDNIIK
jgi:hypothetical protein